MVFTDTEIRKNGLKCLENETGNFAAVTLMEEIVIFRIFSISGLKGTGKNTRLVCGRARREPCRSCSAIPGNQGTEVFGKLHTRQKKLVAPVGTD